MIKRIWLVQFAIFGPVWQMSFLKPPLRLLVNQVIYPLCQVPSADLIICVQSWMEWGGGAVTSSPIYTLATSFNQIHVEGTLIWEL